MICLLGLGYLLPNIIRDYIKATMETNDSQQKNIVEDVLQHKTGYLVCLRESHLRESLGEEADTLKGRLIHRLSAGLTSITSLGGAIQRSHDGLAEVFLFQMLC